MQKITIHFVTFRINKFNRGIDIINPKNKY
jgi:hypothetical protein